MNRRRFLSSLAALPPVAAALAAGGRPRSAQAQSIPGQDLSLGARPLWEAWKLAFLEGTGRVVDHLQQRASHSEGQGYGMFLAAEFNDRDAFERMHAWTEANLALREDKLLSWRWLPDQMNRVPDRNNASDGDLFYAWALLRAANRFGVQQYRIRAQEIAESLVQNCIVPSPEDGISTLFLPAVHGFVHEDRVTVNPSYYMPRAMRELAAATGQFTLANCARDGEMLMVRLAAEGMVPDWIEIGPEGWTPAREMSANAGYEAIRVPLFLVWSGQTQHPAVQKAARAFATHLTPGQPLPVVFETRSGMVLESSPDIGYRAIAALAGCANQPSNGAPLPPFSPDQPYYPATLQLFTMIAINETMPGCVPL